MLLRCESPQLIQTPYSLWPFDSFKSYFQPRVGPRSSTLMLVNSCCSIVGGYQTQFLFCIWMFCWYDFPQLQVLSVWSNDVATDLFLPYMVCTVATGILSTVSLHVICALWPLQYRWSGNRGTRRVHKLPKKQLSWLGKTPKIFLCCTSWTPIRDCLQLVLHPCV